MWSSIGVILIVAVGIRAQLLTSSTGCLCVNYYLCSMNNTIIDDGSNQLGGRGGPAEYEECTCPSERNPLGQRCGDVMQLCCHVPQWAQTTLAPQEEETTLAPQEADTTLAPQEADTTPVPEPTTEEPDEELSWDDCGIKGFNPADVAGRVITSDDTSVTYSGEFPWMAMLLNKRDGSMLCGGSVLHHHVIMTAAHCVRWFQAPDVLVRVGVWNTQDLTGTQTVQVERILRHGQFGGNNYWNDIALLVLREGLQISYKVQPICLPQADTSYDNMLCMATGWGAAQYTQRNMSELLKKVDLKIVPHAQCQKKLRGSRLSPFFKLHNSFVCANGENNADTCIGDGGGPLICQQPGTQKYVQVGIIAAGLECGSGLPGLYANVPRLMPWIEEKFDEWKLRSLEF